MNEAADALGEDGREVESLRRELADAQGALNLLRLAIDEAMVYGREGE